MKEFKNWMIKNYGKDKWLEFRRLCPKTMKLLSETEQKMDWIYYAFIWPDISWYGVHKNWNRHLISKKSDGGEK